MVYGGIEGASGHPTPLSPMVPLSAAIDAPDCLVLTVSAGETAVVMRFTLILDCVEVSLAPVGGGIGAISLHGSFVPAGGARYLLPIMQGMLWDGRGEPPAPLRRGGARRLFDGNVRCAG